MSTTQYKGYNIEVENETDPINPREWDNLGTMICLHGRYNLGDKHNIKYNDFNSWDEIKDYIISEHNTAVILPLGLYDHGNISMYVGTKHDRWDGGSVGFIYCTMEDIEKEGLNIEKAEEILTGEVKDYNKYLTGDIYRYTINKDITCECCKHTEQEFIDGCGGYYDEDEALSEAKGTIDYLVNKEVAS